MGEIKFRAWDKEKKEMVNYIHSILFEDKRLIISLTSRDGIHNSQEWDVLYEDDFELMQFTGLKDKDGVEIYKGDIMYVAGIGNMLVNFINGSFCLIKNDRIIYFHEDMEQDIENVIGNIWENPGLLEK